MGNQLRKNKYLIMGSDLFSEDSGIWEFVWRYQRI